MKKALSYGVPLAAVIIFTAGLLPMVYGQMAGNPSTNLVLESSDYTGDGSGDIGIFRASTGLWAIRGNPSSSCYFGHAGDIPASGDYNGDGTTEVTIYRGSTGLWAIKGFTRVYFGDSQDIPVPADYDGDGSCDVARYDSVTGAWSVRGGVLMARSYFGKGAEAGDLPIPGDYDGDGTADQAIFRPSTGLWAIADLTQVYFGKNGDIPV
ncbi:MAG TPA: hypothetical protein ENH12_02360, partial [Proteobacteria bacterium]|nr:hypothetical protein [Pseudomonadota bacterium]